MLKEKLFDDISAKIAELIAASPARDVEKNARAMLTSAFAKLELVTREEFAIQQEAFVKTREKLSELETRIAALEKKRLGDDNDNPQDGI